MLSAKKQCPCKQTYKVGMFADMITVSQGNWKCSPPSYSKGATGSSRCQGPISVEHAADHHHHHQHNSSVNSKVFLLSFLLSSVLETFPAQANGDHWVKKEGG